MIQRSTGVHASSQGGWNMISEKLNSTYCGFHAHHITLSLSLSLSHTHTHSDPHSVTSLLVQQLLSQFSTAFLADNRSSTATTADVSITSSIGGGGVRESTSPHHSLKEFLCQDTPLLLMLAIQLVGQKVRAELLLTQSVFITLMVLI